jgi:hypothetical protein
MKQFIKPEKIILTALLVGILALKIENNSPTVLFEIVSDLGIVLILIGFGEIVTRLALSGIASSFSRLMTPFKNKTNKL